ncbi:hypothetical protein SAMN02745857_00699 [Andreprevotia lacus DSM 23236]|jgi:uncharacterized protein (DUF2237 family)|uniref:DUF2237 domain-containing protein n=1 Tax=Andreprevotia lacus DSM 23236 TaxID=1121001 RepID=A0A1W1X6C3_9NEIS|nr:DUF2237 domain-containing protein [Andreprevotia lacus]SMC19404.1 hypothetical protein SAMN02745857_00699 [Andreprevotia lacus DSM 23236]
MSRLNVFGQPLIPCSLDPLTGFMRDGCCSDCDDDHGKHTVCAQMSASFLAYSKSRGNDLSTPCPEFGFAGLKPGDQWCLCALRWVEALLDGMAPPIVLAASDESILDQVSLETLVLHAVDRPPLH